MGVALTEPVTSNPSSPSRDTNPARESEAPRWLTLRGSREVNWPGRFCGFARRKLPCNPFADTPADFLGGQHGLVFERSQSFVDGREHLGCLGRQQAGCDPVGNFPHLLRGEFLQRGFDFGHGAHAAEVGRIMLVGKSADGALMLPLSAGVSLGNSAV